MSARRCDVCSIDWPSIGWTDHIPQKRKIEYEFDKCPQCNKKTKLLPMTTAISKDEARRLVGWARFEAYYEAHERARAERGDISPDALGRLEGKEVYTLEQALRLGASDS